MLIILPEHSPGGVVESFPIADSNIFNRDKDFSHRRAYYCTGLSYRMLICPYIYAEDELLVTRPGLYIKGSIPLAALLYYPSMPRGYGSNEFYDDVVWIVNSYLFALNSRESVGVSARLFSDYSALGHHGETIFDRARVRATEEARFAVEGLLAAHSAALRNLVRTVGDELCISNYRQTTLAAEVCSHADCMHEAVGFANALAHGDMSAIGRSNLIGGAEWVECDRRYNRTTLSFYQAAMREPWPNVPGASIAMFKNFYNIIEYVMAGEGEGALAGALRATIGDQEIRRVVSGIEASQPETGAILVRMRGGQSISQSNALPPLSGNDPDLTKKVAHWLYFYRNAVMHSKKTWRGEAVPFNISPGFDELRNLEVPLAVIRPIAEAFIRAIDPGA